MIYESTILPTTLLFIIISLATSGITPTCTIVKNHGMQDKRNANGTDLNCIIRRYSFTGCNLNVTKSQVKLDFRVPQRGRYVNMTVSFNASYHKRDILIYSNESECYWIRSFRILDVPLSLRIDFFPMQGRSVDIDAGFIIDEECDALHKSVLVFGILGTKSLRLDMKTIKDYQYNFTLFSGVCNITCAGSKNECNVEPIFEGQLPLTLNKEYIFSNLSIGHYYCMRIGPSRCPIHSVTKQLVEANYKHGNRLDVTYSYSIAPLVLIGLAILMVFIFYVAKTSSVKTNQQLTPIPEIFLLYWNESPEFLDLMASFRALFSAYSPKVWDAYSENEVENVSANMHLWLDKLLTTENLQIILVQTDAAKNEAVSKKLKLPSNYLDNIFPLAVAMLYNERIVRNIIIVRFNHQNFKPFRFAKTSRYSIPRKLDDLIFDLFKYPTLAQWHYSSESYRNDLKEEFLAKLSKYKVQISSEKN